MTRAEVATHCTESDCWVVLEGRVFDVTEFLDYHPGSRGLILGFAGRDATVAFKNAHAYVNYAALLSHEQVGVVVDCPEDTAQACSKGKATLCAGNEGDAEHRKEPEHEGVQPEPDKQVHHPL